MCRLKRFGPPDVAFASCVDDTEAMRKCFLAGYFANCAQLTGDGLYHTLRGAVQVAPHHTSVVARFGAPPEWIVFSEIVHTKTTQIRDISKIDPNWLVELANHYYVLERRR